ncbi:MAG: M23 family metallopeptidase [Spirochaetia bacterium]
MILEADTLMQKRGNPLKNRPFSSRRKKNRDGLLHTQVVKRKDRHHNNRGKPQGKRQAGLRKGLLYILYSKITGAYRKKPAPLFSRLSRLFNRRTLRTHATFITVGAAVTAAVIFTLYYGRLGGAAPEEILLPEGSSIDTEMIHYVGPEGEARGSGEPGISDISIVNKVNTFSYTIKSGDTLSEIAAEHDLDVGTLISFNDIEDVRRVNAGTDLTIPDVDGIPYTVKRGDTLEMIAARYQIPIENLLDANDLQSAVIQPGETLFVPGGEINEYEYKKAMGTLFVYPSSGRLTSGYGYRNDPFTGIRRMHYGIDLAGNVGADIKATMGGTVASVGNQPRGYGKYVVIQHPHGFQSLYGHLSTIHVRKGASVSQGQKLGEMGSSGRSTGSHLHFSLYKNNVPVNPLNGYLYQ